MCIHFRAFRSTDIIVLINRSNYVMLFLLQGEWIPVKQIYDIGCYRCLNYSQLQRRQKHKSCMSYWNKVKTLIQYAILNNCRRWTPNAGHCGTKNNFLARQRTASRISGDKEKCHFASWVGNSISSYLSVTHSFYRLLIPTTPSPPHHHTFTVNLSHR